eukprot:COSAG01_NODE_523_length_15948_cov_161.993690_2_plen_48_part_00
MHALHAAARGWLGRGMGVYPPPPPPDFQHVWGMVYPHTPLKISDYIH